MSTLLEQAIVDAEALKEAAINTPLKLRQPSTHFSNKKKRL
jgi:hypothetical protein